MTELEQLKQQLEKQEKLASLGMLSAGIAHEIQNPLNFVINFSKMSNKLLDDLTDVVEDNAERLPEADREDLSDIVADLKENMTQIMENGERAVSIIQGILLVSRGKENEFVPTDVCHIVKEYVRLSYHAMRANCQDFNVTLREQYQEGLPMIMAVPQDLSRAVLNVMNNACYAVWRKSEVLKEKGEDYSPEIEITVATADNNLVITIADNGEGMSDEVKQRLFENFFTTKPIGLGTGLGMSITRDIIENKHGGKVLEGTKTQLGTIGITGLKFLELKGGGQGENIPVGGEIPSEKSGWDEITGKASVIAEKLESILNQFNEALKGVQKDDVEKIVKNVGGISTSLDELLVKNKKEITSVIKEADTFMKELNGNMDNVKSITTNVKDLTSKEGSLAKTLTMMEEAVADFRTDYKEANIQEKVDKMFGLVESTQRTVDTLQLTFERSTEKIDKSLDDLSDAMSNFSEFTRIIMENPSSLFGGGNSDTAEDKK